MPGRQLWLDLIRNTDGSPAVEFAIIAPLFFMILFGIFQFSIAFSNYLFVSNAAVAGAQALSVSRGLAAVASPASGPRTLALQMVTASAPTLVANTLKTNTVTKVNGNACATDLSCASALNGAMGKTALVTVQYPCNLTIMGVNYAPNCLLTSSAAQMVQ